MNTRNDELWQIYTAKAKCCYSTGYAAQAAQLSHRAEEIAATFDPSDIRRGISYSLLALCYFSLSNYTIAEDMFRRAEHIYSYASESSYRRELGENLARLGAFAKQNGVLPGAKMYHSQSSGHAAMIGHAPKPNPKGSRSAQMLRTGVQRMRTMDQVRKENEAALWQRDKPQSAAGKLFQQLRSMCQQPQPILSASGRTIVGYS